LFFFYATTNLFRHLTRLFLHNARFDELQMHRLLNSCEQLQHLVLNNCDSGDESVLKINMPNSKISYLKLRSCCFEKVEFLCLPKLSELHYELWYSLNTPFSFGIVPCLEEVHLVGAMAHYQPGHNLSVLLRGTKELHALTLDFQGEKIKIYIHSLSSFYCLLFAFLPAANKQFLFIYVVFVWCFVCSFHLFRITWKHGIGAIIIY
ncbi:hypothetical protein BAE44_0025926, partial [Dichanthelium oligosanthes]